MRIQPVRPVHGSALLLLGGLTLGSMGCGPREAAPPASASASPSPPKPESAVPPSTAPASPVQSAVNKPAPPPAAQPAAKSAPAPATPAVQTAPAAPQAAAAPPAPVVEVKPAATAPALKPPAPAPAASPVTDPGGEVAVKASKGGLARLGAAACKLCHKVQFASWSESAHAKRTPPLDCENCHGAGSEYKSIAVMKDSAKARAAGLVQPGAAFCATCHKRGWNDGMLKKAHAHKA